MAGEQASIDDFIAQWVATGGSELANTQSFVSGLCALTAIGQARKLADGRYAA